MALAARIRCQKHRVVVVVGDGEINEGSVWEAAMSAAKHKLSNLAVFIDYNKLQSYGPTREVLDIEPLADKWRSFGFAVEEVDGHDVEALEDLVGRLPLSAEKANGGYLSYGQRQGLSFRRRKGRMAPQVWTFRRRDRFHVSLLGLMSESFDA